MRTLNLGILAHVDAGKTTLTERLLFTAGAIDHVGSVDAGTTQTDSLELERERGITIRSAVASFLVGDLAVNLVDTPGHPDFIAEVERVLGVLDGAVLVVSAVEGVQPQTPLLFRALQRLRVPTLIFVNKIDRAGADPDARPRGDGAAAVAGRRPDGGRPRRRAARRRPSYRSARTTRPSGRADGGPRRARRGDPAGVRRRRGGAVVRAAARAARPCRRGAAVVHPVFFGSAALGIGDRRAARRRRRAPGGRAAATRTRRCPGRVFKIERTAVGRARRLRPPVRRHAPAAAARARRRGRGGEADLDQGVRPGRCAAPRRPRARARWRRSAGSARSGSATRSASRRPATRRRRASRGRRSRRSCSPRKPEEQGSLRAALAQLAEQDPLIDVRQDDTRHEIAVSLYGEVQKEVIQATLERDYGIAADFRETTTVCIERPAGVGEAEEVIRAKTHTNITGRSSPLSTNPFLATLGLRIEPAPFGSGIEFRSEVEARLRAALPVQDGRGVPGPDGAVRPRGAGRGPGGLAGDRLPGHDDRLRLRRHPGRRRPTSGA